MSLPDYYKRFADECFTTIPNEDELRLYTIKVIHSLRNVYYKNTKGINLPNETPDWE